MRRWRKYVYLLLFVLTGCGAATPETAAPEQRALLWKKINAYRCDSLVCDAAIEDLPVNQLQMIGSHNSYRMATDASLMRFLMRIKKILPANMDPSGLDYEHVPIPEQLDLGIRSLELDIVHDPEGGRYYKRRLNLFGDQPIDSDVQELLQPGMKVIHIPDIDYNTHYYTFKSAIDTVKNWSLRHPDHLPLFIMVELKTETAGDKLPFFTKALPFTKGAMDSLDREIKDVFGEDNPQLFTPDRLRGNFPTIKEAIAAKGWPSVKEMRGKIVFIAFENRNYTNGHPNLENRMMFQYSDPGSDNAAFVRVENPLKEMQQIRKAVWQGSMVRTRTDAETWQARSGDYSERDSAFASGAQIISTDYYLPDRRAGTEGWTDFHITFDDRGYARTNLLNAAKALAGKYVAE